MTVGKNSLPLSLFRVAVRRVGGTLLIFAVFLWRGRIILKFEKHIADPLLADCEIESPGQIGYVGPFQLDEGRYRIVIGLEVLNRLVEMAALAQDIAHALMCQRASAYPIRLGRGISGELLYQHQVGLEFGYRLEPVILLAERVADALVDIKPHPLAGSVRAVL